VFLLSRIRERYNATGDTQRAVAEGLATSARTISSAALIMVAVFMVFVLTGLPSIQQIGLGNAVAILVDATIVRLALVPAAMKLLGKWNWWMPARPARLGHFARHYGEMVLAMAAGMVVLGPPIGAIAGHADLVMLANMGVSMTVPMVAWMRYRGNDWRSTLEMAASMIVPTLAALAVLGAGAVEDAGAVMVAEHLVMLLAMAGAMLAQTNRSGRRANSPAHASVQKKYAVSS
jgi:uncharacterized membrane protein YdfJ with MMPL/SSD domain